MTAYDHMGGQRVNLPVGSIIQLPAFDFGVGAEKVIRDDDGWRVIEYDQYLKYDIEEYNFDVIEVGPDPFDNYDRSQDPDTIRERQLDEQADTEAEAEL